MCPVCQLSYELVTNSSTPSQISQLVGSQTSIQATIIFSMLPTFNFQAFWQKRGDNNTNSADEIICNYNTGNTPLKHKKNPQTNKHPNPKLTTPTDLAYIEHLLKIPNS
jgi:hypothetical protein